VSIACPLSGLLAVKVNGESQQIRALSLETLLISERLWGLLVDSP
jgi:hypothetical protein